MSPSEFVGILCFDSQSTHSMANSGKLEADPTAAAAGDLKRELMRVVREIVEGGGGGECGIGKIDEAGEILRALRDLTLKKKSIGGMKGGRSLKLGADEGREGTAVPEEFRCPLSNELMQDPVILATGQVRLIICLL